MSEQFDASRPIYAQLVERLKARILAGIYAGGPSGFGAGSAAAAGVNPNTMQRLWPSWKVRALCAPSAPADATSRRIRI